jgi:uncharacterized Fe-S cluster protein YjdI
MDRDKYREYCSEKMIVRFYPGRCIHAAECVRGLPEVFCPSRRPWIIVENASPDRVAEVIDRCPSGALEYVFKD